MSFQHRGRTIFIIGGGLLQVPVIQTAKTMGLKTVVADMNPDALGFKISDFQIVMSTKDVEGMVREAKRFSEKHEIHAVITAGTDASMTVAAVANSLNLPGIRYVDAEAASNKIKMRKRLKEHNVPIPGFHPVWSIQDARDALDFLSFPLVMKPADNMGARGVIKVGNREELQLAFKHAKKFCPTGEMILEEYMEGPELSVDALSFEGEIYMTGIADRIIEKEPYFIEMGHNMPSSLPKSVLDEVECVMRNGMKALGITLGAGKGDIKVTKTGVKVGEIAARLSGGFMSAFTYPLSSGVNLNRAAILVALGERPDNLEPVLNRVSIERSLLAPAGKLLAIHGIDEAKKVDGVCEIFIQNKPGDIIKEPTNNIEKTGHIIISAHDLKNAEEIFQKAKSLISFESDDSFSLSDKEIQQNARNRFGKDICWVCKVCDGTDCASGVPGMGGIGNMLTFQDNSLALKEYSILPTYIRESVDAQTDFHFLGKNFRTPIMTAPVTGAVTNMNSAISESELAISILKGAIDAGSIGWLGDGASPDKYLTMIDALEKFQGSGVLICKPRADTGLLRERFAEAERINAVAVGMDIDAVNFKTLIMKNQSSVTRSASELEKVRKLTRLPFILKGVLSTEDAKYAIDAGADCIVVSNHGGRVLDDTPGTARVLPSICELIAGRIPVLVDGGVRNGMDAFKMLALGANGVLVGRPIAIYAVGAGSSGVKLLLNNYLAELKNSMTLSGAKDTHSIEKNMIFKK